MLVKVYSQGCPICNGEVRGNYRDKYYCKACNLLFRSFQLSKKAQFEETITDNPKIKERNEKITFK